MSTASPRPMNTETPLPTLGELGRDLLIVGRGARCFALFLPVAAGLAFVLFASTGRWALAVIAAAIYTFYSYGSTSHDLVHNSLALPSTLNHALLSLIELMGLRSGHAYRAAHLHHHAHFPDHDDVEGAAAHGSLLAAIISGPLHQLRITRWALARGGPYRRWIVAEVTAGTILLAASIVLWQVTIVPAVWCVFVVLGSWTFPLITAYLPHSPHQANRLLQTIRFRGVVADKLFRRHLYHLEHHLYPAVPHQNWPQLAKRLDPLLDRAQVPIVRIGF